MLYWEDTASAEGTPEDALDGEVSSEGEECVGFGVFAGGDSVGCIYLNVCFLMECGRLWNVESGRCMQVVVLSHSVISIDFHPSGVVLGAICGTGVYVWDYKVQEIVRMKNERL